MQATGQMLYGDSAFHGMIKGDVTVSAGARLDLIGMVKGDLCVEQGGLVTITGMVAGEIDNRGGSVERG